MHSLSQTIKQFHVAIRKYLKRTLHRIDKRFCHVRENVCKYLYKKTLLRCTIECERILQFETK